MNVFDGVVTYSGWVASLIGLGYIGVQHVDGRRKGRLMDDMALMIERLHKQIEEQSEPAPIATNSPGRVSRDQHVRVALIRAAAGHQSIRFAVKQLRGLSFDSQDVLTTAEDLRSRRLLKFDEPLDLDTRLDLET
jgi:hypothetical protein